MTKRSSAMTGTMELERFLWKYVIQNKFFRWPIYVLINRK